MKKIKIVLFKFALTKDFIVSIRILVIWLYSNIVWDNGIIFVCRRI